MALHSHLTTLGPLEWTPELYPMLEEEILGNALRFKTDFVSGAQAIY